MINKLKLNRSKFFILYLLLGISININSGWVPKFLKFKKPKNILNNNSKDQNSKFCVNKPENLDSLNLDNNFKDQNSRISVNKPDIIYNLDNQDINYSSKIKFNSAKYNLDNFDNEIITDHEKIKSLEKKLDNLKEKITDLAKKIHNNNSLSDQTLYRLNSNMKLLENQYIDLLDFLLKKLKVERPKIKQKLQDAEDNFKKLNNLL